METDFSLNSNQIDRNDQDQQVAEQDEHSPAAEAIYLKCEYIQNFIFLISLGCSPLSKTDWENFPEVEHF